MPCLQRLERFAEGSLSAALDAEVPREGLHRCRAIGRRREGGAGYEEARRVVGVVLPITAALVDHARELLDR